MTKHFGTFIVKEVCTEYLTLPVLVRAMGMHLGDFEREVFLENNTRADTVRRLAAVLDHGWLLGAQNYSAEEMFKTLALWDGSVGPSKKPFCGGVWEEPKVVTEPEHGYDSSWQNWILTHPRFTLQAATKTLQPGRLLPTQELYDALAALRYKPGQELVDGKRLTVWCWNPLDLSRPMGTPAPRVYAPKPPSIPVLAPLRERVITVLYHAKRMGITEIPATSLMTKVCYGKPPTGQAAQQRIRNFMTECGWTYNHTKKAWVPGPKAI